MSDVLLDRYAKTRNGEEIYPIQVTHQTARRYKEVILNEKYATTDLQEAKYPLEEYGNEYTLEIPIQIAGKEKGYFPRGYPITNDNWVIVPEVDGKEFIRTIVTQSASNQHYRNGDEYYPANGEFACDPSGSPQYARTSDGEVIFPLDAEGNESYLKDDGESHVIYMGDVLLDRYAKTKNGEEIYPIQVINPTRFKEVILNEKYAKTALQEAKYLLDEYGNEYTLEIPADIAGKEKDYFPLGYPITNYCWVIIPEVNGKKNPF
ncbi:uncharacterized protein TNCT_478281 [Trichonephila clavata]|uniref:Uncharacterized protein n=1 Tax=Trichonephila clavata TaxID=2740835 RepID=A0A8X6GEC2_TRICU|nr:uncharacterized protein TNCT_478281 [Trichonephila clavata]